MVARQAGASLAGSRKRVPGRPTCRAAALIGLGAVVLENTVCESGYLYAGIPAKKIKPLDERLRNVVEITPPRYMEYASWFQEVDSKNELKVEKL
jgi:carbonic anhydrase/acetyltransferase-like protein (isoleucine patch superfamily)